MGKQKTQKEKTTADSKDDFAIDDVPEKSGLILRGKTIGIDTGLTVYEKAVPMVYGYIRVSTIEQNEARQVEAMRSFEREIDSLVIEKCSGKDFNRPKWSSLIESLRQGDLLVVKSIDRLGRNYDEIIEWWRKITKEIKADIVVLDMPLLDTRSGHDLTGKLISDIVLQLLSYVAQTEREFIRERQREGIEAAKARGVYSNEDAFIKFDKAKAIECFKAYQRKEMRAEEAAKKLGISRRTFYRRFNEYETESVIHGAVE